MRHALEGHDTRYPEWAVCLDMAHGDPLRAKEIYTKLDRKWYQRWAIWKAETRRAKVPDQIIGMYSEKNT